MSKPRLEMLDYAGIPIGRGYLDSEGGNLKGTDLWGGDTPPNPNGKNKKKKTKKVESNQSANVAKKALQTPIFVEHGEVMPFQRFQGFYGNVIDETGYKIITDIYQESLHEEFDDDEEPFLYQFCEGTESNPFCTKWYPVILDAMKKPSAKTAIHKLLEQFVESNSKPLAVRYPTTNVMLNNGMINSILRIGGMDSDNTKEAVTEMLNSMDAKTEFKSISKSPHQVVFTAMLMAAYELKEKKMINDMITLVAFTMYPLIFRKYFPVTDPNPQAMEEVVITASKKFYIAKTENLLEWVRILTTVPCDFYKKDFEKPNKTDKLIISFLNRLRNTMNQQFKSLYGIYIKAYNKRSIGKQADEDFLTLGSNQDKVHIYTMGIVDKINSSKYNAKVARSAAEYTRSDPAKIEKYVQEYLRDTQYYGLKDFVSNILTLYFGIGQHNEFLEVAIKQYPRIFSSKDRIYNDFRKYLEQVDKKFLDFDDTYLHRYLFGVYVYLSIQVNIGMNQITNKLADLNLTGSGVSEKSKLNEKEDIG